MEEYGMNNNNNSDGHEMKQHFQRFAKQLSDWYCDGKTPGHSLYTGTAKTETPVTWTGYADTVQETGRGQWKHRGANLRRQCL